MNSPDRWRQKSEPLRDWRRSSVLLHLLLLTLANANYWSLCRNDGRKFIFVRAIKSRIVNLRPAAAGSKVNRRELHLFIGEFHQKLSSFVVHAIPKLAKYPGINNSKSCARFFRDPAFGGRDQIAVPYCEKRRQVED